MGSHQCPRCGGAVIPQPYSPRDHGAPVCHSCRTADEHERFNAEAEARALSELADLEREAENDVY